LLLSSFFKDMWQGKDQSSGTFKCLTSESSIKFNIMYPIQYKATRKIITAWAVILLQLDIVGFNTLTLKLFYILFSLSFFRQKYFTVYIRAHFSTAP